MEVLAFQKFAEEAAERVERAGYDNIESDGYSYFSFKHANRLATLTPSAQPNSAMCRFGHVGRDSDAREYPLRTPATIQAANDVIRWLNGFPLGSES